MGAVVVWILRRMIRRIGSIGVVGIAISGAKAGEISGV